MSLGGFAFEAALAGIPIFLVWRAWERYLGIETEPGSRTGHLKVALVLISASTVMWLAVLSLMLLEDLSAQAKSIAEKLSPGVVGVINLGLCAGALGCSRIGRGSAPKFARLRMAIGLSGGCLMVIWLLLAANPH